MTYQATPTRNGNYRLPPPRALRTMRARRRRTPTAYLIAAGAAGPQGLRGMRWGLAELGSDPTIYDTGSVFKVKAVGPAPVATMAAGSVSALGVTLPAWFIPVIGPAVAAVTFGLTKLFNRAAGRQKVAATQIVEEATRAMEDNLIAFQAGPRTVSSQAQALANFDAAWQFIEQNCGNPELGDAGRRCIAERRRGSQATCFINGIERSCDLFKAFRDPIAFAERIVADPTLSQQVFGGGPATDAGGLLSSGPGGGVNPLIWIIGGGALIWYAMR